MMILNKIISKLKEAKDIAILPHISVDGDGLGSSIALALALKKLGKEVYVFLEEDVPGIYGFLPGKELIRPYNGILHNYSFVVALDTGDLERLGKRAEIFKNGAVTANIDHHNTNSEFGFYNYVNTGSSAVGEIIYQLIKMAGLDLDEEIAVCLYVAIATDTGGFRYSNTTSVTHQITSDLINNGVNVAEISQSVFDSVSYQKVKLTGMAISSLELFEYGKVAFITISDENIKQTGAREEDCEGIVNIGRNIDSVEAAVMFRQKPDEIKVNFRSKKYVDVSKIANMYSGGGHKRASGCIIKGSTIEEAKTGILEDIKEVLL